MPDRIEAFIHKASQNNRDLPPVNDVIVNYYAVSGIGWTAEVIHACSRRWRGYTSRLKLPCRRKTPISPISKLDRCSPAIPLFRCEGDDFDLYPEWSRLPPSVSVTDLSHYRLTKSKGVYRRGCYTDPSPMIGDHIVPRHFGLVMDRAIDFLHLLNLTAQQHNGRDQESNRKPIPQFSAAVFALLLLSIGVSLCSYGVNQSCEVSGRAVRFIATGWWLPL
jgi:hypothetical protein